MIILINTDQGGLISLLIDNEVDIKEQTKLLFSNSKQNKSSPVVSRQNKAKVVSQK